jgi:hypothetical protein
MIIKLEKPSYVYIFTDCAHQFSRLPRPVEITIHIHSANGIELVESGEYEWIGGEYKVGDTIFRNVKYRVFSAFKYDDTLLLPLDKKSCWSRVYEWFNGPPDVQIVRVTFDMT